MARFGLLCALGLVAQAPLLSLAGNVQADSLLDWKRDEPVTPNQYAAFAPGPNYSGTNVTGDMSPLQGRSLLDMIKRDCPAGSYECSDGSGCCDDDRDCCQYDYCMLKGRECCPGGSCQANWGCCGQTGCYPPGGACCSDDGYCDPGNICVRHYPPGSSTYSIVCCTDLQCTAVVSSGSTVMLSTGGISLNTGNPPAASPKSLSFQQTSETTPQLTITPSPSAPSVGGGVVQTYATTFRWSYTAYFWTIVNAKSVVTSSTVISTTTLMVTGTDAAQASSTLSSMASQVQSSLNANPPAQASTGLASLASATSSAPTATSSGGGGSIGIGNTPSAGSSLRSFMNLNVAALAVAFTAPGLLMIIL